MVQTPSLGTRTVPLKFAKIITQLANKEWEDGTFIDKVTSITRELLRFWDPNGSYGLRKINFHKGQWQAILNAIYTHEILKSKNVMDMYMTIKPDLLQEMDLLDLKKEKYEHPKYCIKMATGTGKTWVLHALLIWQYLNAKYEESLSGRYSKNFLLIAPGLIVYERLLDAYLGKEQEDGTRNFQESDFTKFEELFVPMAYKEEIFGFIQSSVANKEEIGRKVTGDGLIAITNWHLLDEQEEEEDGNTPLDSPQITVREILPITPGTTAGHSLDQLDRQYFHGKELEYLSSLPNLVVFNDEAHHLGEFKTSEDILEKKWQKAISSIAENKKESFIQIDFSATPYSVTGSSQKRIKHYFPHIIINFELPEAIREGLVKAVAIDKRKELAALPLDFKAERGQSNEVLSLSGGQRTMLRAGMTRLRNLEDGFTIEANKFPKMLITCEDTKVVPLVKEFLRQEGLGEEEIMEIHSNKKGDVGEEEWKKIKQRLFNIDKHANPKIIVSVLMLREGFDVNSICVIVPLRSSSSPILLEQTLGRGLRLMWREKEYEESKRESREKLLLKKEEPDNSMDILFIIEHPNFIEYYDDELGDVIGKVKELPKKDHVVGDIITVTLKPDYEKYDFFWPIIIQDKEEHLVPVELNLENLEPYPLELNKLKTLLVKEGDVFYGEELTVKTKFGEYAVKADIFTAKSYNTFIQKIVNAVSAVPVRLGKRQSNIKTFPVMQINTAVIAKLTDEYIRHKLFNLEFDPLFDNNWRILILTEARIIQHIIKNVCKSIYDLQNSLDITQAKIIRAYFSEIKYVKIRENYSLVVAKNIYPKIGFPSNKGGLEKAFIEFIDSDSKVKSFIKIELYLHQFATILYIKDDGMLANYFPDFLVRIGDNIYLVETKADRDLNNINVKQKRRATLEWVNKVNELNPEDRMGCIWSYVLLGENTFYSFSEKGANTSEILEYAKMTKARVEGTLGDYVNNL